MIPKLSDYTRIVGRQTIEKIREQAEPLEGRHLTHINSTCAGGGISEILNTMVLLFNDLGIITGWRLLKGTHTFYTITKKFHNAMQGEDINISESAKRIYLEETERNTIMNHIVNHDLVIIHDPQPLAMVKFYKRKKPWIWRCHIDIVHRDPDVWNFLKAFVKMYDGMIVTLKKYRQNDVRIPQFVVPVSIDPLNIKNRHLTNSECRRLFKMNNIDPDRPVICQVSRFDKWKNPLGVVKMFELARQKADCQLVLIGDMAADDPEGPLIYNRLMQRVNKNDSHGDIHIITKRADRLVNALQRKSHVIIQNSVREGFGLTVTEALYKGTPVVATDRGGIPLQVIDGKTGFLINSPSEGAKRCIQLLQNEKIRERLGKAGQQHVIKNFLVTRHMLDYLKIFNRYMNPRFAR